MASITKYHKENWIEGRNEELFKSLIAPVKEKVNELAESYYRFLVSEEDEKLMRSMPENFFCPVEYFCFNFIADNDDKSARFNRFINGKLAEKSPVPYSLQGKCTVHYHSLRHDENSTKELIAQYENVQSLVRDMIIKRESFEYGAKDLLKNVRTTKRLRKVWPEIADEFIEVNGIQEMDSDSNDLSSASLNDMLSEIKEES